MCNFKSVILTADGKLIHDLYTDSHEMLINAYDLKDDGKKRFIRLEFKPDNEKYADIEAYKLYLDEKNIPKWFTESIKENVERKLYHLVKKMIITEDKKTILSGCYIINDCKINTVINSRIIAILESSQVGEMWESSKVIKDDRRS